MFFILYNIVVVIFLPHLILRIITFLRLWVENHFYAFQREDGLQESFTKWVDALETVDPQHGKRFQLILKETLGKQVHSFFS